MAAGRRPAPGGKPRGGGGGEGGGSGRRSAWLAADGSKRWGEAFFLLYTPFWLTLCLGVVVPFKLYEELEGRPLRLSLVEHQDGAGTAGGDCFICLVLNIYFECLVQLWLRCPFF